MITKQTHPNVNPIGLLNDISKLQEGILTAVCIQCCIIPEAVVKIMQLSNFVLPGFEELVKLGCFSIMAERGKNPSLLNC